MDAKEIAATVIVPAALGLLPYFLEKRGIAVPNWVITVGGAVTISGLCFGLFHLMSWWLGKGNWILGEIPRTELLSYVTVFSIAAILLTLWITKPWQPDLTKFPTHTLELVSGKTFVGGVVEIDGKLFEHCTFRDVTLMYHGTDTYSFITPTWQGSLYIRSDNKALHDFETLRLELRKIAKAIKVFDLDKEGNPHPLD